MSSIVSPQSTTYSLQPCMPSCVSRQLKAYPMRPFCIHSLSHAVRCLTTAEDKVSASMGMYVLKRTLQWLRDKIALDAGTLLLNLQYVYQLVRVDVVQDACAPQVGAPQNGSRKRNEGFQSSSISFESRSSRCHATDEGIPYASGEFPWSFKM
jgi:hypothetical protein